MREMRGDNRTVAFWGLGTGIFVTLFLIVRNLTLSMGSAAIGGVDTFLIFAAIVLAMISARRSPPLPFIRALRLGTGITFVSATLSRLYLFIHLRFIDDGWFDALKEHWISRMRSQGVGEEQIRQFAEEFSPTPLGYAAWDAVSILVAGFVFSAILALFLRKAD